MNRINYSKKVLESNINFVDKIKKNEINLNTWLEHFSKNINVFDLSEIGYDNIQGYFGAHSISNDGCEHEIYINFSQHVNIAFEIFFHELLHAYLKEIGFPVAKLISDQVGIPKQELNKFIGLISGAIEHQYIYKTMKENDSFLNLKLYFSKNSDQKIDRARKVESKVGYFSQNVLDIVSYSIHFFDYEKRLKNFLRNNGQKECIEEANKIMSEFKVLGELDTNSVLKYNEVLKKNLTRISREKNEIDIWKYCGLES